MKTLLSKLKISFTTIKKVKTDNDFEFLNSSCQSLFHRLGIKHQHTCPYTLQQNGRVEIKLKHLLQITRTLLFQVNLPSKFWGEALLHAIFLINRIPSQILDWKSPFEILFKEPPDINEIKTFGSLCFASNLLANRSKLDPKAFKCIFLGYPQNQNGFTIFCIET